jgi:hypothetical protein
MNQGMPSLPLTFQPFNFSTPKSLIANAPGISLSLSPLIIHAHILPAISQVFQKLHKVIVLNNQ